MSDKRLIRVTSVMGGEMDDATNVGLGQFMYASGIDPDLGSGTGHGWGVTYSRPSGAITPTRSIEYTAAITDTPIWIIPTPKSAGLLYVVTHTNELVSYLTTASPWTEVDIGNIAGNGNGAAYYNNYIYVATGTDISRYGPLDGTPGITNTVWTGTTLGSKKPLTDTTYPIWDGSIKYPNHPMHVHSDNKLYIGDYNNGQGIIHYIQTTHQLAYDGQGATNFTVGLTLTGGTSHATGLITADNDGGATGTLTLTSVSGTFADNETITDTSTGSATANGTTVEGAGNNGSTYNALDLPFGYKPVDIESYGTDLVILAFQTNGMVLPSKIFFWDTTSSSFYREVNLPLHGATALLNVNGELYIFGASVGAVEVLAYLGGYAVKRIDAKSLLNVASPMSSGVAAIGHRLIWSIGDEVRTLGYGRATLPSYAKNNIFAEPNDALIAGLQVAVDSGDGVSGSLVMGSSTGLLLLESGDTAGTFVSSAAEWVSEPFFIGRRFRIMKVRIPLDDEMSVGESAMTVQLLIDQNQTTVSGETSGLPTVNVTNFPNSERLIVLTPIDAVGEYDFAIRLAWASTTNPNGVVMPIEIEYETYDD